MSPATRFTLSHERRYLDRIRKWLGRGFAAVATLQLCGETELTRPI